MISIGFKTLTLLLIIVSVIMLWNGRVYLDDLATGQAPAAQQTAAAAYALARYGVPSLWLVLAAILAWTVSESTEVSPDGSA